MKYCFYLICVNLLCLTSLSGRIIFVDDDAVEGGDGSSWLNAFKYLQDGLGIAQEGDAVWVAEGTYRPDQGASFTEGDREAHFKIKDSVKILGAFSGEESGL